MTAKPAGMRQLWIGTYPVAGQGTPTGMGEGIWAVTLDTESGHLSNTRQVAITPSPSYLAQGADGSLLYAVNEESGGGLTAFRIQQDSLERVGHALTGGEDPCHLVILPGLSAALVANYTSGSVALVPLGLDGVPQDEPSQLVALHGSGPNPERQQSSHAHYLLETLGADTVLVIDLGADCIRRLHVDRDSGALLEEGVAVSMPSGSGPRHGVFSADRRLLYVLGELDGLLHTIAWNGVTSTGEVIDSTEAQPGTSGQPYLAHIVRTAADLIVGSRGSDSMSVHHLGADGLPRFSRTLPLPGSWPRHHAVVGGWLVVAQQGSGGVAVLDRAGRVCGSAPIPSPACILPDKADSEDPSHSGTRWLEQPREKSKV